MAHALLSRRAVLGYGMAGAVLADSALDIHTSLPRFRSVVAIRPAATDAQLIGRISGGEA